MTPRLLAARCASFLIAVLISAAAVAAAPSEASLRAADAEQMRIIVQEDASAQQAFMHDNYIINGPANRVMRKDVLTSMLSKGGMASERFEREIEGTAITGNVGVVMGRETVTPASRSQLGKLHGRATLRRRFTNVFLFENGKWRFLARQATIVNE
ncbi:MAG: DUF4440 domain-containing protein [Xanthomonadaceae bacterium]|nr:DUF4440 domain-containing protein [Xanthomonadaceae bacterium]